MSGQRAEQAGALFAAAPVGLAVVDRALRLVAANPAFAAINAAAGGPARDLAGLPVAEALARGGERVAALLGTVVAGGEPVVNLELDDGGGTWLVSAARLDGGAGLVVVDVSERTAAARSSADAARATSARLALLEGASDALGTSLEIGDTMQALVDLTVPSFADVAVMDLLEEPAPIGTVAHAGPLRRHAFAALSPASLWSQRGEVFDYPDTHPARRVLATGRSVLLPALDGDELASMSPTDDMGRMAAAAGVHSVLSVALRGPTTLIGTVSFARGPEHGPFDDDDLALAEQLAVRAGVAIEHAELFASQRQIALTLQRAMLPATRPEVEGLDAAWRYLPGTAGTEVGGDWFDLIPLPIGRVGIVIGDVMGRGLKAAAVMGQLRAAARAYALLDLPPHEVMARLDDLVHGLEEVDEPELSRLVTCVYAIYDPGTRRCWLANAGHLPPIVVDTDGRTSLLTEVSAVPLGVGGVPFSAHEVELAPGQVLALYTDGLIEHRGRDLDSGIEELRSRLAGLDRDDLERACDALLDALRPPGDFDDDAALLLLRVSPTEPCVASTELAASPRSVAVARRFTAAALRDWGLDEVAEPILLLLSELVTNAVTHSPGQVQVRLRRASSALYAEVIDSDTHVPRVHSAGTDDEGGRGLHLVEQLAAAAGRGRPGRWGVRPLDTGKVVWVEVPLPRAAAER